MWAQAGDVWVNPLFLPVILSWSAILDRVKNEEINTILDISLMYFSGRLKW